MSKKRKAGANIKSIEEMINEQESVAEPYLEALDKSKESMAEKFIEAIDRKNNENMGDKEMKEMVNQDVKEMELVGMSEEDLLEYKAMEMTREDNLKEYLNEQDEQDRYEEELESEMKQAIHEENMEKAKILNANIRGAIIATKDMGKRGLLNGQLKAIINDYKNVTGIDLDEKRIEYIKTLKDEQASYVIKVIGAYKRYLRLQQNTQLATVQ